MTLSQFLRDYLYIPLGGNRHGEWLTCRNLMITFVLGGLWHGASWTFVFWGALHGFAMVSHRLWSRVGFRLPALVGWFLTFNFVNITWVFFRARSWEDAIKVLSGMFGIAQGAASTDLFDIKKRLLLIAGAACIAWLAKNSDQRTEQFRPTFSNAALTLFLACIALLGMTTVSEFLYFNF